MIELELTLVFLASCFFSILYVVIREGQQQLPVLWFGIIAYAGWQAVALMWIFITPMESAYAVAIFFQVIAFMFLLHVMVSLFRRLRLENYEESELD